MSRRVGSRRNKPKAKAIKKRARATPGTARRCGSCALPESESRRLVMRGERRATKLAICEGCVREFARALSLSAGAEATTAVAHEPEAGPQVPAPAEICGWQKFRLDGKKLEWRAERTVLQAARPAVLVHVRLSAAERPLTMTMHPGSTPTREDAERAGHWLVSPPADDPELSDGPEAFGPLGVLVGWQRFKLDGLPLEWSAERAYVYEATPYVQIEVREYRSSNRATTYLDWRTEPTMDHAIAAARELWGGDAAPAEV